MSSCSMQDLFSKHRHFNTIDLSFQSINSNVLTKLAKYLNHPVFHSIDLGVNNLNSLSALTIAQILENNRSLQSLYLNCNHLETVGLNLILKALENNSTLTVIDLSVNHIKESCAEQLAQTLIINKALQSLKLDTIFLGKEGLEKLFKALAINTTLTSISFGPNSITDEKIIQMFAKTLTVNTILKEIDLSGNDLRYTNKLGLQSLFQAIKTHPNLQSLDLRSCNLGAHRMATFTSILHNMALISLNLDENRIGLIGAKDLGKALEKNSTLQSISLKSNQLDGANIKYLVNGLQYHKTIQSINLSDNEIGELGSKMTRKLLNHPSIKQLDLSYSYGNLGRRDVSKLAKALEKSTKLQSLKIKSNGIDDSGAASLAKALKKNTTLLSLNLGWNNIRHKGLKAITNALNSNKSLTFISLKGNDIDSEGAEYIADLLKNNPTIHSINLGANTIDKVGIEKLVSALQNNNNLTYINLSDNELFGDDGSKELSKLLQYNTTLTSINLKNNHISDLGMEYLIKALENNFTITSINVSENPICDDNLIKLVELLQRNCEIIDKIQSLEKKLIELSDLIIPQVVYEDSQLKKITVPTHKPYDIESKIKEIKTLVSFLEQFPCEHLRKFIHHKIKGAIDLIITEYFLKPDQNDTDCMNVLNLFLLLPTVEDDFHDLAFHYLERYSLLLKKEIISRKENSSSLPNFASPSAKLSNITKRVNSFYEDLSLPEANYYNKVNNQVILKIGLEKPTFFNQANRKKTSLNLEDCNVGLEHPKI